MFPTSTHAHTPHVVYWELYLEAEASKNLSPHQCFPTTSVSQPVCPWHTHACHQIFKYFWKYVKVFKKRYYFHQLGLFYTKACRKTFYKNSKRLRTPAVHNMQPKKMFDLFEDMRSISAVCLYGFIATSHKKQKNAGATIQPINSF